MAIMITEPTPGFLPAFTEAQLEIANMAFNPLNRQVSPDVMGGYLLDIYGRDLCQDQVRLTGALAVDTYISVPVTEEELTDRFTGIEAATVATELTAVNQRTNGQIAGALHAVRNVRSEKRLLAVSDALAQKAYEGVWRKTGSTHHSHAFGAAAMAHHVFQVLRQTHENQVDPQLEDTVVSLLLLHDAGEETLRPSKHFNPERQDSYHPLLVKRIFEVAGNEYAREAADAMRYMTHLKERRWMPSYMDYILIGSQSLLFCLVKPYDIQHNHKVEPKPVHTEEERIKRAAKWKDYEAAKTFLEFTAMLHDPYREDRDVIKRTFELIQGMGPGQRVGKMVTRLQAAIYTESS